MFLEAVVEFDAPIGCGFDQMDSATRRFRFQAQHTIGRTLIQTKAAVDALVELGKIESSDLSVTSLILISFNRFQLP